MSVEFWKSAGLHLVEPDERGWLKVTPDYVRAYLTRLEIHPVEESCAQEHRLFEALMEDPFRQVSDGDTADNYRIILRFRDHLAQYGTLESAYAALFQSGNINMPPMFIDQMVHLINEHFEGRR